LFQKQSDMTTVSILQISDLHRDPANPIRNDALLSSLENDRARYTQTDDSIVRSPDIIIVSGDVIQGVAPGTSDAPAKLAEQHREALDFLGQLTDKVLAGDRRHVVIVPGNHDVSACHFMDSVRRVDIAPGRKKEIVSQLFSSDSPLRWSWTEGWATASQFFRG
jgi:predicted MPP superfamily phosphohydrolase